MLFGWFVPRSQVLSPWSRVIKLGGLKNEGSLDPARGYKTFFMLNSVEHEIFLLINIKMPTIVGILTLTSGKIAFYAYLSLKKPNFLIFLYYRAFKIICSTELSMKKSFITSGPGPEVIFNFCHAQLRALYFTS